MSAIASESGQGAALVAGSVRCLSMFVDELDEEQVVQVTPLLIPFCILNRDRGKQREGFVCVPGRTWRTDWGGACFMH